MTLQTIKSVDGKDEYVLLPMTIYSVLKEEIAELETSSDGDEGYIPFVLENYVQNLVAVARIKAHLTQKELAQRMNVTQAYISKIESQEKVTAKLLERVKLALAQT